MNYIKKKSARQEDRTAEDFDGRTRGKASGASWNRKGDVKTAKFLIENKFTDKDSFPLKVATWIKIETEAIREGLHTPLIQLDIQDKSVIISDVKFILQYKKNLMLQKVVSLISQSQFLLHYEDLSFIIEGDTLYVFGEKFLAKIISLSSKKYGVRNLAIMDKEDFKKLIGDEIDE